MYYIIALLLIFCGAGMAIYGTKKYNISLALSFVIPNLAILYYINDIIGGSEHITKAYLGVLVLGVLVLLLAKIFTYIYTWWTITGVLILLFATFHTIIDSEFQSFEVWVIIVLATVILILIRKTIKQLVIGLSSGYMVGIGVAAIGMKNIFALGWSYAMDAIYYPSMSILLLTFLGIAYQFYLSDSEKENPKLSKKEVNMYFGGGAALLAILFSILPMFKSLPSNNAKELAQGYCECMQSLTNENPNEFGNECKDRIGFTNAVSSISSIEDISKFTESFSNEMMKCMQETSNGAIESTTQTESLQDNLKELEKATKELKGVTEKLEESPEVEDEYNPNADIALILNDKWSGKFGEKTLTLEINANEDGTIAGFSEVGGNKRPITGTFSGDLLSMDLVLAEPGDDKWDGIFEMEVTQMGAYNYEMIGNWKSNNGKITREFELERVID